MTTEYLLNREVDRVLMLLTTENRLVVRVCLHTGLRVSDVLSLTPSMLKPSVWVRESKTGKKKQIGFPSDLLRDLKAQTGKYWVFPSRLDPKKHRTRQAVWADVKRAAKAFRISQNVGVHSFRKVYAVELMEKYGDIDRVRKALNHGNTATTAIYALAHLSLTAKNRKKKV